MPSSAFLSRIPRVSLLAGAMILTAACAGRTPAPAVTASAAAAPVPTPTVAPAPSAFDIPDLWYSQHTAAARLASLSGGLLVVGFIDNECSAACATTLTSMRAIERETDNGVHFVIVARAADNGTPATLAAFAKTHHLPATRYTLISGGNDAVRKLAATLDARSTGASAAAFETSSMLSVLDFNGILVQQRGYGVVAPVIEALTLLSNIR